MSSQSNLTSCIAGREILIGELQDLTPTAEPCTFGVYLRETKIGEITPHLRKISVTALGATQAYVIAQWLSKAFPGGTATKEIRQTKYCRCRTRKRYVKLLMSYGAPKRWAETSARIFRPLGYSYQKLWTRHILSLVTIRDSAGNIISDSNYLFSMWTGW